MQGLKITDVRHNAGDSAFLIDDGKTAVLYDTGFGFTGFNVADNVKAALKDRKLDYIFLTHSHYDHALGSAYIKKRFPEAVVVAGEYAAKIFKKDSAKALMRQLDKKFALQCGVTSYEDLADCLSVDKEVVDGDVIRAGEMEFTVLNLPGHTKCSVGYYLKDKKLLLGSETIGVYNGSDDVVPSYLVGYNLALKSIERISELDVERVLVPHYGLLDKKETEFYLKKAKENAVSVAEKIKDMLESGADKKDIIGWFKERFYHGYIKTIYPVDAMELNTGITVDLIERELVNGI